MPRPRVVAASGRHDEEGDALRGAGDRQLATEGSGRAAAPALPARLDFLRALGLLLWLGAVVRSLWDSSLLTWGLVVGVGLFLLLAIRETDRLSRLIAAASGLLIAAALAVNRDWQPVREGLVFALLFVGFLPTLQLIRRTLEASPETAASHEVFAAMPGREQITGSTVGAHLLGSVLTLGVLAVMAPLLPSGSSEEARRDLARATLRGLGLVIAWSPFTVGMGFALAIRPEVHLWQAMLSGIVLALAGLVLSVLMFDRRGGLGGMWRALAGFAPLLVPLLGAMLAVIAAASLLPLSTIDAVVLTMPLLCLAWLLAKDPALVPRVTRSTYAGLPAIANELLLFAAAVTIGKVLAATPQFTALLTSPAFLAMPTPAILAIFMLLAFLFPFLGMHSMVSASLLAAILSGLSGRIADVVAVQALLFAWGCGSALSPASMSLPVSSSLFRVRAWRLLFPHNALFMASYGIVAFVILVAANALLTS